jgi:hypothetical protein
LTRELLASARGAAAMQLVKILSDMQWGDLPPLWWLADVLQVSCLGDAERARWVTLKSRWVTLRELAG